MKELEFNGIKFDIGQSAKENWDLLDKSRNINDEYIWFHLNSFPSPYIIMYMTYDELKIKTNFEQEEYLLYGSQLCKQYSKYKNFGDLKIIYMPINKLAKGNAIGEVIITGKKKLIKL
jgi:hypothetical protein